MEEDKIKASMYDTMSEEIDWLRSPGNKEAKLNYVTMLYDYVQLKLKQERERKVK